MKPELWRIYDKKGSNLNMGPDSYINMLFSTDIGKDAQGYAITDPSTNVVSTKITNQGWGYNNMTQVYLDYTFSDDGAPFAVDASIFYTDVSVFIPEPQNSQSITKVVIDSSENFIYPAVTYAGALFLDPVSKGLVETEHLTIFQEASAGYITPYDSSNSTLIFRMVGDETEIQFFTLNETTQEVTWTDELIYDVSTFKKNQGLQINIGFKSDDEGVYERRLTAYHQIDDIDYPLMEIVINAQSIGQDERHDTLLENFGLYKPKSIPKLFKEADINEDLPDWKLLNYKAKHLILEHDKIMPFIGTYKGLINAIKWLGYEDIEVKEWFKNVKSNTKLALTVPYDADGRKKTIKYFSPEERRHLKKLNTLSLVYCITRETGEIDEWGNPTTENCYEYNLNEVLIKLFALKNWLEKNIIGVNARIADLTGEAIYFERFRNFIYGTQNFGTVAVYQQSLTPTTLTESSELVSGDASILLTLKEYENITFEDMTCTFLDAARYGWDPSNGQFSPEEYNTLSYKDPSAVFIGTPFMAPFVDLYDIQWKLQNEKEYGVLTTNFVSNPLFIYENSVRFYNVFDTSTLFNDVSANVDVTIEKGYLRDPSIDIWTDSIAYSVYKDPSVVGRWILESSTGTKSYTWGDFSLQTATSPRLMYAFDDNYKAPLFSIEGYNWTDVSGNSNSFSRNYFLDIEDGKISVETDASVAGNTLLVGFDIPNDSSSREYINVKNFINFNYDTSLDEQKITYNVTYTTPRLSVFNYDPSDASTLYYNPNADVNLIEDNSIYQLNVNHAGDYDITVYGFNGQNNLFTNFAREPYDVWQKYPTINSYIDTSCAGLVEYSCVSTYLSVEDVSLLIETNKFPIFDPIVPLYGLTLEYDELDRPYLNIPSITAFQDLPEPNSISRYFNLTERITDISGTNITIDEDYQSFYNNDSVNLVQLDKGKLSFIQEASAFITSGVSPNFTIDNAPTDFVNDSSTEWYILNDTERMINNPFNDLALQTITCDVSGYSFKENQLAAIIINDLSTGNLWGSSFRVLDVCTNTTPAGFRHVLQGNVPEFILLNPGQYGLTIKHAFSTYVDFQIEVERTKEVDNNFNVYLNDTYFHQYYLDNTFTFLSIAFDQEKVINQWYDPSDNMINTEFYPFDHAIQLDVSTLVIFKATYDSSNYMLNQKNIWEIRKNGSELVLRTHNFVVPYIFDEVGSYDITTEVYDKYGNLKTQTFEGLIKIC